MQKQIVDADAVDATHASAPDDELHFQHFLSANCFGYPRSLNALRVLNEVTSR